MYLKMVWLSCCRNLTVGLYMLLVDCLVWVSMSHQQLKSKREDLSFKSHLKDRSQGLNQRRQVT